MTRRRRGLSAEDRDLWHKVTSAARPLASRKLPAPDRPETRRHAPARVPEAVPQPPVPPDFRNSGRAGGGPSVTFDPALSPRERLAQAAVRMDSAAHRDLVRGRIAPEARIDLHGMTIAEAEPELARFILRSHARGLRLVLVITGKGRRAEDRGPIPARVGILRHQVPVWLTRPPLGQVVLQIAPAHVRHGGEGAYYVYLRRRR